MYTALCVLLLSVLNVCSSQENPIVTIPQGQLRGRAASTVNGAEYFAFQGIPYAKPPVAELRFRPPQPAEPWEGVKDALTWGPVCPQVGQNGKEDCLFINVFTTQIPETPESNLNPVLVFFHGGGFLTGAGEFGPDFLLEEGDIVVVGLNYRLGALGFISLPGTEITSNNGLKDQNLALKWVQENIAYFGGDPTKVTIWGESAGAASVGMQMLSPLSKGLFRGVMAESGSVLTPWALYPPGKGTSSAFELGTHLNINTADPSELIAGLRKATAEELVTATNLLQYLQLTVEIETEVGEGDEIFLPAAPLDLLKQGKYNDVPLLIGVNAEEGAINSNLLDDDQYVNYINQDPTGLLPWQFNNSREIGNIVKEYYFGDKKIDPQTKMQFSNVLTDFTYLFPSRLQAEIQTSISDTPIYFYEFSFDGHLKFDASLGDTVPGVPHAQELNYVFYTGSNPPEDAPDMQIIKRMTKLWANFAKTQNPVPEEDPVLQNVTWTPFSPQDHFYLDIGNDLELKRDLYSDRMAFIAGQFEKIHIPE